MLFLIGVETYFVAVSFTVSYPPPLPKWLSEEAQPPFSTELIGDTRSGTNCVFVRTDNDESIMF
jgi:hypothetical protein